MKLAKKKEIMHMYVPVKHGTTTVQYGALIMAGTTAETNLGVAVVASSAATDTVGVLKEPLLSTTSDTLVAGTVWNLRAMELSTPARIFEMDYDLSDTAAVASTSTVTVTITSLEDDIDTSWLYAVSGTGAYKLAYLAASASGSATSKTATGWDSTTTVVKVLKYFHQLAKLNTAATKIGTDAAAGSWTPWMLGNSVDFNGRRFILDPTKHDDLTLGASAKIKANLAIRDSGPFTLS